VACIRCAVYKIYGRDSGDRIYVGTRAGGNLLLGIYPLTPHLRYRQRIDWHLL